MNAGLGHPLNGLPKLRVELVPSTCWLSNVRSYMSDYFWRKLSKEIAEDSRERCMVCGGRGRRHAVECHEAWYYDDRRRVQALMRLDALCPICHAIKHLGRTLSQGNERMAIDWLAKVNGWDEPTTCAYIRAVFEQHRARSQFEWALDLSVLGEAYGIGLDQLGLESYVLAPRERKQMQHRRETRMEDVYERDGRTAR